MTGSDGSRGQAPITGRPAAQDALASVPPYYVALTGAAGGPSAPWHAAVRATATGKTLSTVSPPRPYGTFSGVSGAADDRTFALAAQRWVSGASAEQNASQPTRFFLLRVNPATGAAPLTALPFTEKQGFQVMGMALSPDGSKLAVTLASPKSPQVAEQIQIFTLATGAEHDWAGTGPGPGRRTAGHSRSSSGQASGSRSTCWIPPLVGAACGQPGGPCRYQHRTSTTATAC